DPGLVGESSRAGTASLAGTGQGREVSHHDGVRSRPGAAGEYRAMLPGSSVAARHLRTFPIAELSQDFWLEGTADLCSSEHSDQLRRDQALRPRAGTTAGAGSSRSGCFRHEEED